MKKNTLEDLNDHLFEMMERLNDDELTDENYLLRKKQMTRSQWDRWEFLRRTVWEENYGPMPKGAQ